VLQSLLLFSCLLQLISTVWCAAVEGIVGRVSSELTVKLEFLYPVVLCRNRFPALFVKEINSLILSCFGPRKGLDFGYDRDVGRVLVHDLHELEMV
jgi:hypothetical protein